MFIANGGKEWIGGLYYIKNILYTLIKNDKISESTKVYIITKEENINLFKSFEVYENVKIILYKTSPLNKIVKKITEKVFKRSLDLLIYLNTKRLNIDYLYPVTSFPYLFLEDKCVYWIPDFQHIHLPEMFSESENKMRNKNFEYIARKHKNLILSSNDSFNDYKSLYPDYVDGVHILSFESFIEDDVKDIDNKFIENTIIKYELPKNFIFLPNQFWKHKNHLTAFKAVNYIVNEKKENIYLVCTGNTEDYRNKEYFASLVRFINENKLDKNILILGFISRKEQLALMKSSKAVIQPSLFEGWGTVVEDAKALDKNIIMSDINVHFEQKNEKCILFEKNNYIQLGNIMITVYQGGK